MLVSHQKVFVFIRLLMESIIPNRCRQFGLAFLHSRSLKLILAMTRGRVEMLTIHIDYFKNKPASLPLTTILLDNGYHPSQIEEELKKIYPDIMTKIRFELSPKPSKTEKEKQGKSGFVPLIARWVIERSNSWLERCKSLTKNFERTLAHANAKIHLCFVRLMLIHISSDRLSFQRSQMGSIVRSPKKLPYIYGKNLFTGCTSYQQISN